MHSVLSWLRWLQEANLGGGLTAARRGFSLGVGAAAGNGDAGGRRHAFLPSSHHNIDVSDQMTAAVAAAQLSRCTVRAARTPGWGCLSKLGTSSLVHVPATMQLLFLLVPLPCMLLWAFSSSRPSMCNSN